MDGGDGGGGSGDGVFGMKTGLGNKSNSFRQIFGLQSSASSSVITHRSNGVAETTTPLSHLMIEPALISSIGGGHGIGDSSVNGMKYRQEGSK
jgi:hypothetical protein